MTSRSNLFGGSRANRRRHQARNSHLPGRVREAIRVDSHESYRHQNSAYPRYWSARASSARQDTVKYQYGSLRHRANRFFIKRI